jgi:hypothetical protein
MKTLTALACLMATAGVNAQPLQTTATSARSASGQFMVTGAPPALFQSPVIVGTNASLIGVQPSLVAISCERVKQAVWRELGYQGQWQNPALIALRAARTPDDEVIILTERANDGWRYRVRMPDVLPRDKYLRVIVQVVLSELADRHASKQPAEVPVWLVEGLAFHLLCNNGPELLIGTPSHFANGVTLDRTYVEYRRFSELEKAHKILIGTSPLTFEELSWPAPRQPGEPGEQKYSASAQLLVCRLLRLSGGPECMRDFVAALPDYLNWQIAFLHGFESHFKRPLDVEKWWALEATEFAGRDLTQTWPYEESWSKLAAALLEPVDVFISTNDLPDRSEIPLQVVVRDWDKARQKDVLRRKSVELAALRLRIAPELMQLTDEYAEALDHYLQELDVRRALRPQGHLDSSNTRYGGYRLLSRLDALDAELRRLQPGADQQNVNTNRPTISDVFREMRLPDSGLRAN